MTKNILTTIYIVRHGQSEANLHDIVGSDTHLTLQGEDQVREVGKKLKHIHFDAFFSSDLSRAKKTAEIIALDHKLAVIAYKELRERGYGKYEGAQGEKYREDLKESFDKMQKMAYAEIRKYRRYDGFETDDETLIRFITFLRELAIAYKGKTILIGSHATLMKVLLIHLGYIEYDKTIPTPVTNAAYIKLESDGVDFFLKEVNGVIKKSI